MVSTRVLSREPVATGFADADAFCARVGATSLFAARDEVAVARAPGRLDVLDGIADCSGALVLALPLAAATLAAAQIRDDNRGVAESGERRLELPADVLGGARAGGGGDGAVVAVLGREDAEPLVREIAAELGTGIVGGSSPGAAHVGVRTLRAGRLVS